MVEVITIKLAAVEGAVNDWALYYAPSHWTDEQAISEGNKLPREMAERLISVLYYSDLVKLNWRSLMYRD